MFNDNSFLNVYGLLWQLKKKKGDLFYVLQLWLKTLLTPPSYNENFKSKKHLLFISNERIYTKQYHSVKIYIFYLT